MNDDLLPALSEALIKLLDERHPPRCIAPGETPEQAHRYAGTRDLIDALIEWQKETYEAERTRKDEGGG